MELRWFFNSISDFYEQTYPYTHSQSIRTVIQPYANEFPDWLKSDIILFGVPLIGNVEGTQDSPNKIREYFYKLAAPMPKMYIADLGNLKWDGDQFDCVQTIEHVMKILLKAGKIVIILGGSQELTLGQFAGYEAIEHPINYTTIDSKLDLFDAELGLSNKTYNNHIFRYQPNFLYHYANLGTQGYFVSEAERKTLNSLHFESLRVGDLRQNLKMAEPILRVSDMLSIDMSVVRHSEAPGNTDPSPAGFSVDEICQLARFAGMGYNLTSLSVSEIDPENDINDQTSHLAALVIWYFIEGFYNRVADQPTTDRSNLNCYIAVLEESIVKEIMFFKNLTTDRWWMEVPYPTHDKVVLKKAKLVPCSEIDYLIAASGEIPEKWWLTHYKLIEEIK